MQLISQWAWRLFVAPRTRCIADLPLLLTHGFIQTGFPVVIVGPLSKFSLTETPAYFKLGLITFI